MVLIIFILLLAYSVFAGIVEGILYGMKGAASFLGNEHGFFVAKLAFIGLIVAIPVEYNYTERIVVILSWWLCHAFFHDGAYYETRRQIDTPSYRWYYDRSATSTARFEISFWLRTLMLVAGIGGLAIYFLLK
jgi:hypothetical protein